MIRYQLLSHGYLYAYRGISDTGYLQLYCNFFETDNEPIGILYITEYQDQQYFLDFSQQATNIFEALVSVNLINEPQIENQKNFEFKKLSDISSSVS